MSPWSLSSFPLQLKWTVQKVVFLFIVVYKRVCISSTILLAFQQGIMLQMEAHARPPTRPLGNRASSPSFAFLHSCISKKSHLYSTHMEQPRYSSATPKACNAASFPFKLVDQWEPWECGVSCWLSNEAASGSGLISVLHSDFSVVSPCDKWSLFCMPCTWANGAHNILMPEMIGETNW